ncbi:unnamed protein product, partial [Schistosoma haematobium]
MNENRNRQVNEYLKFYVIHEIEFFHYCIIVNSYLFQSTLELVIVEGEFSKVNYPQISIAYSSTMIKFEFDNLSNETSQNNSTCIFTQYTEPVVLSGLILTLIGVVLGLIIIFVKKLHSSSTMNTIFIVITEGLLIATLVCWCGEMLI